MPKLKFKASGKEFNVPSGTELLQAARKCPEMPLKFGCTRGECGVCAIKVSSEETLTKQCSQEIVTLQKKGLGKGYRLACQCAINGDLEIE